MGNFCKLTGVELTEGVECPVKKMCLNCKSLVEFGDGSFGCKNDAVMEIGKKKILDSLQVPDGYEVNSINIELKPMALKNPTKKCAHYDADGATITALIDNIFA